MGKFSTPVFSPPGHDGLVIELRCNGAAMAEIRIEHDTPEISFYSTDELLSCTLTIEEFNDAISLLKSTASEKLGRQIQ